MMVDMAAVMTHQKGEPILLILLISMQLIHYNTTRKGYWA